MTRGGWAWLDGRTDDPHRVWVKISEGKNGGLRAEPVDEEDRPPFLEHIRGGGTITLTEGGTPEEQAGFIEGLQEGFADLGGAGGLLRRKPIDKEQRTGP